MKHASLEPDRRFQSRAFIIAACVSDAVCPDMAWLRLTMMIETADVRVDRVQHVHISSVVCTLPGPIEVTTVTGSQVLHEETV